MDKMDKYGMDLEKVNIERLKEIFPECVTDGKVNFDALRTILGDDVETSGEKYSFNWVGKSDAMKIALMPSTGTLRPCKDKSKDWDKTENLYIEGDNLEVLKTLEKTYHNQIKMIYIDPPYNTGKDFVYHDDFHDNVSNYLENSDQAFRTNPETAGRFHTDWLNMMYPRLKIARELLKEEGVIFISLDDVEISNAKKVCDEIFGESNYICTFVRKNKAGSGHDSSLIAIEFDYILCYCKELEKVKLHQETVDIESDNKYKYSDEFLSKRGKYYLRDLDYKGSYSEGLDYCITAPDGSELYSGGAFGKPNTWRWSKNKFEWGKDNGFIVFKQTDSGWKVYIKQYQYVDNNDQPYTREIPYRAFV